MYAALLKQASPPELAAETIFRVATTENAPLRTVVGDDAERMSAGRRNTSDEEWVALGEEMSDEEYAVRFKAVTGIDL